MKITSSQLTHMKVAADQSFCRRMADYVVNELVPIVGGSGLDETDAFQFVRRHIEAARRFGLSRATDLKVYIACAATFGPRFPDQRQSAWARAILDRRDLTGATKADLLHDHLTFRS